MGGRRVRFLSLLAPVVLAAVVVPAGPSRAGVEDPAPLPLCTPGANPITGLKTNLKVVTFTFDDGPSSVYTRPILDAFEARGMRATFFVLGNGAKNRAALAAEMVARGHELGNHSKSHYYTASTNVKEMPQAQTLIETASGQKPLFFRMPGLSWRKSVLKATGVHGLCAIDTNFIIGDWRAPRAPASVLCSRFKKGLKPGSLVILHDGGKNHLPTVKAVPCMLDYATAQGYQVLGLRDFLALAQTPDATLTFKKVSK